MILGALIELGADADAIRKAIASLDVEQVHIHIEPASDRGIHGTSVTVHAHESHGEHHHDHDHSHHHHDTPSRNLDDIRKIVQASDLPDAVKEQSLAVFQRIGEAEAKIHGTTVDKIHFHEVGALDSIADIVGCCLGLHLVKVDGVSVAPLPMGHGAIHCAHGTYPNPAPATVELLKGIPVVSVDEPFEMVTPTGAALLSTWKTHDAPPSGSRIVKAGYAVGHRKMNHHPNVLRATLYEAVTAASHGEQTCLVLETNIDDTNPELIGSLVDTLLREGALDAFIVPVHMKKMRPGTLLTVLCKPDDRDQLIDLIFAETTTFGIREYATHRSMLQRRFETVHTTYGDIRVKIGTWKGEDITVAPEMGDCEDRAREHDVPVRKVYEAALRGYGRSS